MVAIPDLKVDENLKDRIPDLGDSQSIEKMLVFGQA